MPEFANLPVQDLTAIWERQAQKLVESGVPRERVADSLRIASLNFETRMLSVAVQQVIETFRARPEHVTTPAPNPTNPAAAAGAEESDGVGHPPPAG